MARCLTWLSLVACLMLVLSVAAKADMYRAGPRVDIAGSVEGDVVVAGGRVDIDATVRGAVLAAGGQVEIDGQVADSTRVAGGRVVIAAQIGGDLTAAGGSIRLAPMANVAGEAWLAGGHVEVAGWTAGQLRVAAGSVVIAGEVAGDVNLTAASIEILPAAIIRGRLVYRSTEPARIDPGARIEGEVVREAALPRPQGAREVGEAVMAGLNIAWMIGLVVFGAVLALLFPHHVIEAARTIEAAPGRSLALGFVIFIVTPFAAAITFFTILGIPLALALLAIYLISLVIGYITAGFFVGDLALRLVGRDQTLNFWWRVGSLVLAFVIFALLARLPWIGGLIVWVAILSGLGAWYLRLWERYNTA